MAGLQYHLNLKLLQQDYELASQGLGQRPPPTFAYLSVRDSPKYPTLMVPFGRSVHSAPLPISRKEHHRSLEQQLSLWLGKN